MPSFSIFNNRSAALPTMRSNGIIKKSNFMSQIEENEQTRENKKGKWIFVRNSLKSTLYKDMIVVPLNPLS